MGATEKIQFVYNPYDYNFYPNVAERYSEIRIHSQLETYLASDSRFVFPEIRLDKYNPRKQNKHDCVIA